MGENKEHLQDDESESGLSDSEKVIGHTNNKRKRCDVIPNEQISKKRRFKTKDLFKQPTVEELNQLKETENLFHSNLFRLQIEEILDKVKLKEKYRTLFDRWFTELKLYVESLNETEELQFDDRIFKDMSTKVPMEKLPQKISTTWKFLKPHNIKVVGSYSTETLIGPDFIIDIMIEMPAKLFKKTDFENYRYMLKRAMYLTYIAEHITDDLVESKSFCGNSIKPLLKVVPIGKLGTKVSVHLHVVGQQSKEKLKKFFPGKNCIKTDWFFNEGDESKEADTPTPYYNSIILHDLTMPYTSILSCTQIKEYPNIRDGIILLKIWLKQRQTGSAFDNFNGHILSCYVMHLFQIKKLNTYMSSYQIVRNVWNYLAQINWNETGFSLCQDENISERINIYKKYYQHVFLDSTGYHNITAHISEDTFKWIQSMADDSLKCLDNANFMTFSLLFMKKVPFYRSFDYILCIHDSKALEMINKHLSNKSDKLNFGIDKYTQSVNHLVPFLKQGLRRRISSISVLPRASKQWKTTVQVPDSFQRIYIGLNLNPECCFSVVEKGPNANLPEAIIFRQFWGKKSSLRRFKDGTICEAVVWDTGNSLFNKRFICKRIINYLLKVKLQLSKNQYFSVDNQIESFLQYKKTIVTGFQYGTGEEAALQAINAFHALEKDLTNLSDLPLSINGVQGCSCTFRYTNVFPHLAISQHFDARYHTVGKNCLMLKEEPLKKVPTYVTPLEATIQLSQSGKWPKELDALRKTKAAFHIQIAQCLRDQLHLVTKSTANYIDVFKEGFVFRLRIAHPKEIALMKKIVEDGVVKYRDTEESLEMQKNLFHLPTLNSALHGLHCQQPSFGPACCLAKRWLSAHLIDNWHMPSIAVELIMASIFLQHVPHKPPQMPQVAFLRFLVLCADNNWHLEPVVVNFNDEISRQEIIEIENSITAARNSFPPLVICTPYDRKDSIFTKKCPSSLILTRIATLAKEALQIIENQLFNDISLSFDGIFKPPLSEYDCIIYLKDELNPRRQQAINLNEDYPIVYCHPYKRNSKDKIPIVNFDPVQLYLKELRKNYNEFALFFHDTYGGSVIGVLLKPTTLEIKEFKVSTIAGRKLNEHNQLILNINALLDSFYNLGQGLVQEINFQSKRISLN